MNVIYPAVFHKEESSYWVEFPNLPGCDSFGDDIPDTLANAKEALAGYCAALLSQGKTLPAASQIQSLRCESDEDFVSLVETRVEDKERSVKKTLTIPYWLNARAEELHAPYSQLLQDALEKYIGLQP